MPSNPIKATSRTFNTILNDINSDPTLVDKPDWWKRVWAGVGDMLSIILNAQSNNAFLRTAFTRQAVKDLTELIDYTLQSQVTANGGVFFDVDSTSGTAIFPFSVVEADLKGATEGSSESSSLNFEARADETFSLVTDTFTANFTTDELTVSLDFTVTGWKVQVSTSGTLPDGLSIATDYYVIYTSATIIKLATTRANALLGVAIDLIDAGTGTHTVEEFSKLITLYQQDSQDNVNIGISDASTEFQEFDLPDQFVLADSLTQLTINSITWTVVTTFVDSISTSKHFKILVKSEGQLTIQFGNGTFGLIPPAFDIFGNYATGGGDVSNVTLIDSINSYTGTNSNITLISNPQSITGGSDEENIESAKKLAPLLLKSRDRFVTTSDGEALALGFGGLSQVKVNKNAFGVLSAQVVGIALGGGNPSTALKSSLETFLIDRTILESIDVRVQDTTITTTAVTSQAKMINGFSFATVQPFLDLAFELLLVDAGQEIKDDYDSNGLISALVKLNTILNHSFTNADAPQLNLLLTNLKPAQIGQQVNESDVFGYVDNFVIGVEFITISVFGTGLPLILDDDEITTNGTITTTEIP